MHTETKDALVQKRTPKPGGRGTGMPPETGEGVGERESE